MERNTTAKYKLKKISESEFKIQQKKMFNIINKKKPPS